MRAERVHPLLKPHKLEIAPPARPQAHPPHGCLSPWQPPSGDHSQKPALPVPASRDLSECTTKPTYLLSKRPAPTTVISGHTTNMNKRLLSLNTISREQSLLSTQLLTAASLSDTLTTRAPMPCGLPSSMILKTRYAVLD
jgi:hypothetical protein